MLVRSPGVTLSNKPLRHAAAPEAALTIGAIGVVFGDIGTSPLYAIDQVFYGPAHIEPRRATFSAAFHLSFGR